MFTNSSNSYLCNIKKFGWVLALPLIIGVFLSSCGDSPIDAQTDFTDSSATNVNNDITIVPERFNAVGTIQGTVIDKATGKALSDVAVSLQFMPEEADEPDVITDTTGSEGAYAFTGVPVNTDAENYANSGEKNSPYTLKITTENLDNYRDLYRMNSHLSFEGTGGDGAATNLVSDITIPLSEQAVTISGKAHTTAGAILSDVDVELYQTFNPIINGGSDTQTDMIVDSATTDSDGSFSFEGVEEKANVWLRFKDDSDPTEVINYDYTSISETPAGDGTDPEVDLGVINVSSSNESGAFYLTNVTPAPNSDVPTDTVFKYEFNRPVADNEYTRTDLGFGNGTIIDDIQFDDLGQKKAPGDVEFSASFSSDMKTLTIDPDEGTLKDANNYELEVNRAFRDFGGDNGTIEDEFGNQLSYTPSDYSQSEVEFLDFSTNDNNQAPHTPDLAIDSDNNNVDWNTGDLNVEWDVSDDPAEVKEYEVFVSKNGGAYKLFFKIDRSDANFGTIKQDIDATGNPAADDYDRPNTNNIYNDLLVVDNTVSPMDQSHTYELKVRAVSANLQEGDFSDPVTFKDVVKPDMYDVDRGLAGNNNDDKLYVKFDEPLMKGLAEDAANYTINDGGGSAVDATINSITYNFNDLDGPDGADQYSVIITVDDTQDLDDGIELKVSTNVTDLNDNGMDTNTANY